MPTRRQLLSHTTALLGGLVLPVNRALGQTAKTKELRFVFVVNYGGWDVTRVFANEFWNGDVDMEANAEEHTLGGITYVAHEDRPSVTEYFERFHATSLVLNGVQVPSIAHDNCLRLILTGGTSPERADWPSILGYDRFLGYSLPHLVIAGPAFPGVAGSAVTRTGSSGQLEGLLTGSILEWSDTATSVPTSAAEARMDAYLSRRLAAVAEAHSSAALRQRAGYYRTAHERGIELKDLNTVVDWSGGTALPEQIELAVDALALGISRCTMLASDYGWDSHTDNDVTQNANFEGLFGNLLELQDRLATTASPSGGKLAEDTVIVVLSEMARTPQLNGTNGKDHWPYTSVLVTGPGVTGDRVVGDFDPLFYGKRIDRATGELHDEGHDLNVEELGATLLKIADVDPGDYLTGVEGIDGVITR